MPTDLPPGYQPRRRTEPLSTAASTAVLLILVAMVCGTIVAVTWMITQ